MRKPDEMQRLREHGDKQEIVAKGSRMEALDSAADEILKAAKELEKEVRRETKYWQEIVSVSDKGWPIQRLRQNARHVPFGVRYGLPEGVYRPKRIFVCSLLTRMQPVTTSRLAALPHCIWTKMVASFWIQRSG